MRHPRLRELVLLAGAAGIFAIGWIQIGAPLAVPFFGFLCAFGAMHLGLRVWAPQADPILVPVAAFLVAVGTMSLASIDLHEGAVNREWQPLAPLQVGWLAVGTVVFLATVYVFRNGLGPAWRTRYTLALLGLIALVAPLIPYIGYSIRGARLWVRLGPLSFQPAEATKVFIVLFLAAYLAERRELLALPIRRLGPIQIPDARYLAPLLGIIGLALLLFVRQTDLGSSLLFFLTFLAMLWIGSGRAFYPITGIALFAVGAWFLVQAFSHVAVRFQAWMDPWADPQNAGFQIIQGMYALAEGGLTGMGLTGADSQPHLILIGWADMILVVIGHTLGLAGLLAVVMAFLIFLTRAFFIALRSNSDLHALAAAGFGIVLGVQTALIAGGVLRVLPLTGVTLPFVSYGGSSLVANFAILGCLVAISNAESTTSPHHEEQLEEAMV